MEVSGDFPESFNYKHYGSYTMASVDMILDGKIDLVRFSFLYDMDLIRIHDPFLRKSYDVPMKDFNNFEGNCVEFVADVIKNNNPSEV